MNAALLAAAALALVSVQLAVKGTSRSQDSVAAAEWADLDRFRASNAAIAASAEPRIVFMGDSLTEYWSQVDPAFQRGDRLSRGIIGQTSAQMLLRMQSDVIALDPDAVHILAGTNDLVHGVPPEQVQANVRSMVELAQAHGIAVIVAAVPPLPHAGRRAERFNRWLEAYAAEKGAVFADYWGVLHQGSGFRPGFTYDGVHLTKAGYAAIAPVREMRLAQAIAARAVGERAGP